MKILIAIFTIIIILAALSGNIMSRVEQPYYKVINSKKNIEIREYGSMILAEVEISGERKQAIREGFKKLANYIQGNNASDEKIEMTAPVTQELYGDHWKIQFVMPKQYTLETLPTPNSKEITLNSVPVRRFAVILFSGLADDKSINQYTKDLEDYISAEKLKRGEGGAILAFYNPPWTLPFLRRNEVMIEIKADL